MPDAITVTTDALITAHRNKTLIPSSQAPSLAKLEDAFAVQERVTTGLGAKVAGWKVTRAPDGPLVTAPFYQHACVPSGSSWTMRKGGMIWEVEIAFELKRDLPARPDKPYTREEVMVAIGTALIGIEMVGSRFDNPDAVSFITLLSDNHGCAGYVTGTRLANWTGIDFRKLRCTVRIDGKQVFDQVGSHPKGDPLKSLVDYAGAQHERLGGLRAGQIITTGSWTGVTPIHQPAEVAGEISDIGTVSVRIIPN